MADTNLKIEHQFIKRTHIFWTLIVIFCIAIGGLTLIVPPIVLIGFVIIIVSVAVIFKYPYIGLLIYLATFILRPGEIYPALESLSIERIIGVFVLVAAIWHYKRKHGSLFKPDTFEFKMFFLFWILMLISWGYSYDQQSTYYRVVDYLKLIIVYLIVAYTVDSKEKYNLFVGFFVLLIAYVAFMAFRDYYGGGAIYRMGITRAIGRTSAGGDPNTLAITLDSTLPLVFAFFITYKNWIIRTALLGIMALFVIMVVNTGSRSGILGLLVILGITIYYSRQRLIALVFLVLILIGGWFMLPGQYQQRYLSITKSDADTDEVSSGRISIWENGIRMFLTYPVQGVGAGAFRKANATGEFGPELDMQAHSLYVQLLATVGLVGTIIWFLFLSGLFKKLFRERISQHINGPPHPDEIWVNAFKQGILSSLVVLMIGGVFGHSLYRYTWYLMAAIAFVLLRLYNSRKEKRISEEAAS